MRIGVRNTTGWCIIWGLLSLAGCSQDTETGAPAGSVEPLAPEPATANVTVFEGARLIVGDGTTVIENSSFVVEDDLFVAVGGTGEVEMPAGATVVDLSGKTVMPAKVDLHGHLGFENVIEGTTSKENFTRENLIDHLQRFAYLGFSTVVSIADYMEREIMPGDHLDVYQAPRDPDLPATGRMPWGNVPIEIQNEVIPNAALFHTAGPGMSWPGAGAQGAPARNDIMYPVRTEEEARQAVRDYVRNEVAFIKIWQDDRDGRMPKLPQPVYEAIIDEASRFGVSVAAHTVTLEDAKGLYRAGLVGSVHMPVRGGDVPDEEFLELIRERTASSDVPLWFTDHGSISAMGPDSWDDPLLWEILSPSQVREQRNRGGRFISRLDPESVERGKQRSLEAGRVAKQLIDAGMIAVFGSDNGSAGRGFGWYGQLRFENLVNMGFTPHEAIVIATRNGAEAAGLNTGMVEVGRSADFIVLDENPLVDISNTRRIDSVYLRGDRVDREGMRARWQSEWAHNDSAAGARSE